MWSLCRGTDRLIETGFFLLLKPNTSFSHTPNTLFVTLGLASSHQNNSEMRELLPPSPPKQCGALSMFYLLISLSTILQFNTEL